MTEELSISTESIIYTAVVPTFPHSPHVVRERRGYTATINSNAAKLLDFYNYMAPSYAILYSNVAALVPNWSVSSVSFPKALL